MASEALERFAAWVARQAAENAASAKKAEPAAAQEPVPTALESQSVPLDGPSVRNQSRPGALPGDPPAPVVHPDATLTLARLELASAGPTLSRYGSLTLAYPKRAPPELWAEAQRHQADIVALLAYRARLEALWPT